MDLKFDKKLRKRCNAAFPEFLRSVGRSGRYASTTRSVAVSFRLSTPSGPT